jgi:hypothetical protein
LANHGELAREDLMIGVAVSGLIDPGQISKELNSSCLLKLTPERKARGQRFGRMPYRDAQLQQKQCPKHPAQP